VALLGAVRSDGKKETAGYPRFHQISIFAKSEKLL
jgi:hypothetical protein